MTNSFRRPWSQRSQFNEHLLSEALFLAQISEALERLGDYRLAGIVALRVSYVRRKLMEVKKCGSQLQRPTSFE